MPSYTTPITFPGIREPMEVTSYRGTQSRHRADLRASYPNAQLGASRVNPEPPAKARCPVCGAPRDFCDGNGSKLCD